MDKDNGGKMEKLMATYSSESYYNDIDRDIYGDMTQAEKACWYNLVSATFPSMM